MVATSAVRSVAQLVTRRIEPLLPNDQIHKIPLHLQVQKKTSAGPAGLWLARDGFTAAMLSSLLLKQHRRAHQYYAATFLLSKIDLYLCVIEAHLGSTCPIFLQPLHKRCDPSFRTCLIQSVINSYIFVLFSAPGGCHISRLRVIIASSPGRRGQGERSYTCMARHKAQYNK